MEHGLETMALTASHTIEGDRAILLPVTEGEGPTHSDSQADTPPHMRVHWLRPEDIG